VQQRLGLKVVAVATLGDLLRYLDDQSDPDLLRYRDDVVAYR
jgi:hypothetical protein